jgi:hypothetical protein
MSVFISRPSLRFRNSLSPSMRVRIGSPGFSSEGRVIFRSARHRKKSFWPSPSDKQPFNRAIAVLYRETHKLLDDLAVRGRSKAQFVNMEPASRRVLSEWVSAQVLDTLVRVARTVNFGADIRVEERMLAASTTIVSFLMVFLIQNTGSGASCPRIGS